MSTLRRILLAAAPLLGLILLPVLLRRGNVSDDRHADQLVIVSPHNEAIRYEFERAFTAHCRAATGRDVDIDWRTPGGTSEIARYVVGAYTAAFKNRWTETGNSWTHEVQNAFLNRKLTPEDADEHQWNARRAFLESNVGIGIDLFFGGGQYDLGKMAAMGVLVPCGLRTRQPDLFAGEPPILSPGMSGEVWYDHDDRYYGTCLSAFGLCYNLDTLRELGYDLNDPRDLPNQWRDLADPRLFGRVGVADPSKSGSINKAFEMLIQQQLAATVAEYRARLGREAAQAALQTALDDGWERAFLLIRMIGGNALYFTFSASKVPVDVAHGQVAAGMCIGFYGRSQAEWEREHVGRETMRYVTPAGGSSISADPIGLLRGAPNPRLARQFLDFVFSTEGQRLWNARTGTPGGPERYALRRLPIRRDMYTPEHRALMSDPDERPFELAERFEYHPEWTGRLFGLIRVLIRVAAIDCHPELREAWCAILDAGGPEAVPHALEPLRALPVSHGNAGEAAKALGDAEKAVFLRRRWASFFREQYREAARRARAGRRPAG